MSNLLRKIRNVFGFADVDNDGYEDLGILAQGHSDYSAGENELTKGAPGSRPFWPNSSFEISILEPQCFEEMPQIIQLLRDRKSVILNLNRMAGELAQRTVDFVAGGTLIIDGHQEKVGENIFLFTPNCVQVGTHLDSSEAVEPVSRLGNFFFAIEEDIRVS